MTTCTCVAQYAVTQKTEKSGSPKIAVTVFLARAGKAGGQWGFLEFFFCRLTPTQRARSLSEAARPPACIVAGSFGARQGGLQGRPSVQHVPASLFGNRRAGPER